MASTPMDVDGFDASSPVTANGLPSSNPQSLNITRAHGGLAATAAVPDVISAFRPTKLFRRDDIKEGRPVPHVLSLDYDDPGELLMTAESDDSIQIYRVRDGRHDRQLLSKKYGVKLARFTRTSSAIIYASTKQNDAIRYLTTHDNVFVRYFEGHQAPVTNLAMHPGNDDFISCGRDNTVRLWNSSSKNATGVLHLASPYLSAWDPSGQVFAVGSPDCGAVLLYDHRNFDRAPFQTFDIVDACSGTDPGHVMKGWNKLEFSNDGRHILLGTRGPGHFLLDAFTGRLKAHLRKPEDGRTGRAAAGEDSSTAGGSGHAAPEGSGDCCFTPDGRYVIGGARKGVVVWDTNVPPQLGNEGPTMVEPAHILEDAREAAVLEYNPRFNFLATADQQVVFWVPDPHA